MEAGIHIIGKNAKKEQKSNKITTKHIFICLIMSKIKKS